MPESPHEFYERVLAAAGPDGRLAVPEPFGDAEIFPYEWAELSVRPFEAPVVPEPPRNGDPGGTTCGRCARGDEGAIWANERWILTGSDIVCLPFAGLLESRAHFDFGELDTAMAGEMGQLMVAAERAVKSLGSIGRVHVYVWGDGAAHTHVWVIARPLGLLQLRGSCLADWTEVLPSRPAADLLADQRTVVASLVRQVGGRSHLD